MDLWYLSSHFFLRFLQVKQPVLLRIMGIGRIAVAIPEPEPEEGVVFWFVGDIVGQTGQTTDSVKGTRLYCE